MNKLYIACMMFVIGMIVGIFADIYLVQIEPMPYDILKFKPVDYSSNSFQVEIAQAELSRHGIECGVDRKFGKQTAIGICELLVKIENGYEIKGVE